MNTYSHVAPEVSRIATGRMAKLLWRDGEDPYESLAPLLPDTGTFGATDQMWAVHLLGAQRVRPEAKFPIRPERPTAISATK